MLWSAAIARPSSLSAAATVEESSALACSAAARRAVNTALLASSAESRSLVEAMAEHCRILPLLHAEHWPEDALRDQFVHCFTESATDAIDRALVDAACADTELVTSATISDTVCPPRDSDCT